MGNETTSAKDDILTFCDLVECLLNGYVIDPKDEETTDARGFVERMREKYGN